jgi:asparagine synthase (glutamine-hydrolysing)
MREFLGYLKIDGPPAFASQPESPVYRSCHVLHRGFIANRAALAAESRLRGLTAGEMDEAELLVLAYHWWGEELSRHVTGEFAVAIYDTANRRLVLAHDEIGLMPMYYSAGTNEISFASHLDDLVNETGTGELDEEYFADYFARAEHFGHRTPYAHLSRLLPGESLVCEADRSSRRRVWTLASIPPLTYKDTRDYDEHFRKLVDEAVASATPAGKRIWCELSGGLDSSTVLAFASRQGIQVAAVSFVYSESYTADDRNWMDFVLKRYPVPWHPIDVDSVLPFSEMPSRFPAEPLVWVANAAFDRAYMGLLDQQGVDVVLTGEGGDSVLFGDLQQPFFLADLLLRGRIALLWADARRWARASDGKRSLAYALLKYAVEPGVHHLRHETLEYRPAFIPWASPAFARRMQLSKRGRKTCVPGSGSVGNGYVLQRIMRSANLIATHTHHRHISCEFRNPLLYRPLVEFMLAIPWDHKLRPGGDRLLQRRAFADILPREIIARTDKGGSDQPWFAGLDSAPAWIQALTVQPRLVERGWVDLNQWRSAVQRARVGRTVGIGPFRASAAIELWLQHLELLPTLGTRAVARMSGTRR